ncbi:MAG TPA: pyridoxal-phosphate dependent enzyme, partial [Candidatus Udaeobacter sp.]|nr:pyridoxal-phosphate dependent enzyme [Candidatus Udaeobacter sp.]
THSSGNHAAAVARAAAWRGIPAWIVMPKNAPAVKCRAVESYGGKITFCEPKVSARSETAKRIQAETGAAMIHPYDDDRIIAGQATAAKEMLEEIPDLDAVLTPVSGGGLLSGTCLGTHGLNPEIRVYGCEPELADDAYRSLKTGTLQTMESSDTMRMDCALHWRRGRLRFCGNRRRGFYWWAKKTLWRRCSWWDNG